MRITHTAPFLDVEFDRPQAMLSWALHHGGRQRRDRVSWLEVRNADLPVAVDPLSYLQARLSEAGRLSAVGLMTSGDLRRHVVERERLRALEAVCVATVGLSNALRVGDPPVWAPAVNTINLLCWIGCPLSDNATLEALSIASEARTLAVYQARVPSRVSGDDATGTGTDCIVIASPTEGRERAPYAGKHTEIGHLIGRVVERAIARGIASWRDARGGQRA